jgi:hypothetical protein
LCHGAANQSKIKQRPVGCSHDTAILDPALACDRLKTLLVSRPEHDVSFNGKNGDCRSTGDVFRASVYQLAAERNEKSDCWKTHR